MRWHLLDRELGAAESRDGGPDAEFWASPVGQAARAKLRGDRFFQIELDGATLTAFAEMAAPVNGGRRVRRTCDLLGQIEELGWHLEHVSWWRADADDPDDPVSGEGPPGPQSGSDHVRGVYLFHSVPASDAEGTMDAMAGIVERHVPMHRRDVS